MTGGFQGNLAACRTKTGLKEGERRLLGKMAWMSANLKKKKKKTKGGTHAPKSSKSHLINRSQGKKRTAGVRSAAKKVWGEAQVAKYFCGALLRESHKRIKAYRSPGKGAERKKFCQ